MDATLKIVKDKEKVARQFTEELREWVADKETVSMALSGGSTPKTLFQLWTDEYLDKIDWSKFTFYWGDERCVPPDDEESNYGAAYDLFLQHLPESDRHVERMRGEDDPEQEAQRYADLIAKNLPHVDGIPQFDVMLMGMGDDGHTASIFPDQMHLLNEERFAATATHPDSGQTRVTLTGPVICQSKWIVYLVTGEKKAEPTQEIFTGQLVSVNYPTAHIEAKEGEMTWYVDEGAAKELQG